MVLTLIKRLASICMKRSRLQYVWNEVVTILILNHSSISQLECRLVTCCRVQCANILLRSLRFPAQGRVPSHRTRVTRTFLSESQSRIWDVVDPPRPPLLPAPAASAMQMCPGCTWWVRWLCVPCCHTGSSAMSPPQLLFIFPLLLSLLNSLFVHICEWESF